LEVAKRVENTHPDHLRNSHTNNSFISRPTGASVEDRAGVEKVLQQAFGGLEGELAGKYYDLGGLTDEQRDFLLERGFLFQIPTAKNLLTGAGAARSWPDNRCVCSVYGAV
jgi:ATP:guanido phosphotransferase, C-terminal catalytic domain